MFNPHCKNDACSMFWPICLRYSNQENNQRLMFLQNGGGGGVLGSRDVSLDKIYKCVFPYIIYLRLSKFSN